MATSNHPLNCHCGHLQGQLTPGRAVRAVCYCRDCQAFARFLGHEDQVLDANNGTEVIATLPRHVQFTAGLDALACMSLSPRGLLRWYASCCRTPIGNTPRDARMPYIGVIHTCLGGRSALAERFGPVTMAVNRQGARTPVPATPLGIVCGLAKVMSAALPERFTGRYRDTPFFSGEPPTPIRVPEVLTREQRASLTR
ncbi:MAG: DUF6151 family protein [Steroidobacteraceae bacterium]